MAQEQTIGPFSLEGQVQRMWQDMYLGNGQLPLTVRVKSVEEAVQEFKDGQRWVIRLLIGTLVSVVLTLGGVVLNLLVIHK